MQHIIPPMPCLHGKYEGQRCELCDSTPLSNKSHPRFIHGYTAGLFDRHLNEGLVDDKSFKAGQRSGIHMTLMLAGKLAFRITLVIALAVGVLVVFS